MTGRALMERELERRLERWLREQLLITGAVRIEGFDQLELGHSAEMLMLTLVELRAAGEFRRDVVVKLRPPSPGLLEPYDLGRQFRILRALEPTSVRAPRALWFEATGDVLGRAFYVMERLPGEVYEQNVPADPGLIPRMCEGLIDEIAAIHAVDLPTTGLDALGDPASHVDRQLDHWEREMRRVQKGPLPALERLLAEVRHRRPAPSPRHTLVHGDAKPGNFAFVADRVSGVFDWELTDVGDPMADIGYLEVIWGYGVGITGQPTTPPIDDLLGRYEERAGRTVHDRPWYRAFQAYKIAVILLVGSMLFEDGHTDDVRCFGMALGIDMTVRPALRDLGIEDELDAGPVLPSDTRLAEAQARAAADRT